MRALANIATGHYWTLRPFVGSLLRPGHPPAGEGFSQRVGDPEVPEAEVTGIFSDRPEADTCLVAVHGLGGDVASPYLVDIASEAWSRGLSVLRLELRGANGSGNDLYNAGLSADLATALASQPLARFAHIVVVGYSLGGHLVLRWASEQQDMGRVRAIAAIGSPLDLRASAEDFDRKRVYPYRRHVLESLKRMAIGLAAKGRLPVSLKEARAIDRIVEWDNAIVARRFGYADAAAYYADRSVAPHLDKLTKPALYVGATHDPMVSARAVRPALDRAGNQLEVRWLPRAGHVGFPANADLGQKGELGLEAQLVSWLMQHTR